MVELSEALLSEAQSPRPPWTPDAFYVGTLPWSSTDEVLSWSIGLLARVEVFHRIDPGAAADVILVQCSLRAADFASDDPDGSLNLVDAAPGEAYWPSIPALQDIVSAVSFPGALYAMPQFVSGMDLPEGGEWSQILLRMVGAIRGTEAGTRLLLAGGMPDDRSRA